MLNIAKNFFLAMIFEKCLNMDAIATNSGAKRGEIAFLFINIGGLSNK